MKILIGGLLEKQQRHIIEICPDNIELRFIDVNKGLQNWISAGSWADRVILMTDFVSHKHTDAMVGADYHVVLCHGGLTRLKALVREMSDGT